MYGCDGPNSKRTIYMKTKYALPLLTALLGATAARGAMSQQAYIKASNTDAYDQFGYSLALAGNTLVVAANYEASAATGINGNQADNSAYQAGAAYVFVRDGTNWSTNTLVGGSSTFRDPQWTNYPMRVYRVRTP